MKTILIGTSRFGKPVPDYYKNLGDIFVRNNYRVIYIFDNLSKDYPVSSKNIKYYTWKNPRPKKLYDYIFFSKVLITEKPCLCISNYSSTRVISIVSYLLGIKNRINYVHSTTKQFSLDFKKRSEFWRLIFKYRKRIIFSINTHLFTNSSGTKIDTINYYNIHEKKISVFPFLIKDSVLKYKTFQERENCICIVGRLHPSKGHRALLQLFAKCKRKFPLLKLKIVGDGHLKSELIELSKSLNIYENLIFIDEVPNDKINTIFSSSLASISSSIDEAYGLVNIEALREGTPIICTRTAGSIDIVEEKKNGLFIDLNDKFSLCNALDPILKEWDFYSHNALKAFHEKYAFNNLEGHFEKIRRFAI